MSLFHFLLILIILWVLFSHLLCGCCKVGPFELLSILYNKIMGVFKGREGFSGNNKTVTGSQFSEARSPDYIMNPSTWSMPSLNYSPGTTPGAGVTAIWDRPEQPIPLPEGELNFFATTPFKPECCPNAYSSSTGCACMTVNQYNYLRERGSNNVPYSQF